MTTPTVPPEWAPHRAIWIGFPSHQELWEDDLEAAQGEAAALVRTLAESGGERVRVMVCGDAAAQAAKERLAGVSGWELLPGEFGDIWLRDTGPIFVGPAAAAFRFNGWGGKYVLPGDDSVAEQLAAAAAVPLEYYDFVLEGGAIDHDGEGTVLTTRECLLNPNRNRAWTQAGAEAALRQALGAKKVIWLDKGLLNDHTDGHVDNLARFVAPGVVAIPLAFGEKDPHAAVYDAAARDLAGATDAAGRTLKVVRIPSPGLVIGADGQAAPASHMNFIIANRAVIMPTYNDLAARFALEALKGLFPEREVFGLPSTALLTGGGSFHCISQQEPA
jgi:agmatine deiminase